MKKVLMTLRIPEHIQTRLSSECSITFPKTRYPMPRAELMEMIAGHDALLCTSDDKIDKELLDQAGQQLKTVCTVSAGYNHMDIIEAISRNIALGNTPDVLTDSVAEKNVALILSCLRGVVSEANSVSKGDWEKQNKLSYR